MRYFNYSKIKEMTFDQEILSLIASIYKEAGKSEIYLVSKSQELEGLKEIAKIQSTKTSNEIEGIVITNTRLKKLLSTNKEPITRNEKEILGYSDALDIINENYYNIPITKNYILQLHKILYSYEENSYSGKCKNVQNYISAKYPDGSEKILFTPLSPLDAPLALENLCTQYNLSISRNEIEPLILIPIFIHDFLCIHPFNDGNGRISRLLTTLLLYRSNIFIGRYISLESKISKTKDLYYEALNKSQDNWLEGKDDPTPFIKYILKMILSSYKDLKERYDIIVENTKASEIVKKAILNKIGKFTKHDIIELCPMLSISSVESGLREMIKNEMIKREGKGKNTYYIRLK